MSSSFMAFMYVLARYLKPETEMLKDKDIKFQGETLRYSRYMYLKFLAVLLYY